MSPPWKMLMMRSASFPRVSGDEPEAVDRLVNGRQFSPRERG